MQCGTGSSASPPQVLPIVPWQNWSPAYCTVPILQPCPLHHNKTSKLACGLIPLPLLHLDKTYCTMSWWSQAHLNPCQGRHLLQEGFGLSSSSRLHWVGCDPAQSKMVADRSIANTGIVAQAQLLIA